MGAAAAPILIGSAVGAATNRKNPMQGALLGGVLGGAGSAFTGLGSLGGTAANTAGATANTAVNTAANTAVNTAANTMPGAVGAFGQAVPAMTPAAQGIFSNVTAPIAVSQPLSSAAGQTAGMERSFGPVESLLNPNIQSSSLNNADRLATGERFKLGDIGQYAQQNPVLAQMALQTGMGLLQQQEPQLQSPGLMRGNQIQAAAPQYQVGIPKVSLI